MKEYRVYVLDSNSEILENKHHTELLDEEFMEECNDNVYTLKGFENAFNREFISDLDIIRILEVEYQL